MALKPDRLPMEYNIQLILNGEAEAGSVLCYSTAGSGVAAGDSGGYCQLATDPSGLVPAGVLELDFVTVDETLHHRNFASVDHVPGEPAPIIKKGWVVSNMIVGTPVVGATAYLGATGHFYATKSATGGLAATPIVGMWESIKDADGYAKVSINIPVKTS